MKSSHRCTAILALSALLLLFGASAASATLLKEDTRGGAFDHQVETGGSISASLQPGTSWIVSRTDGSLANTCTASEFKVKVEFQGGELAGGEVTSLSFSPCTRPVVPHVNGQFFVTHKPGTRNGTVTSKFAEITVGSPFGTLNCKTGSGADLGTLTGVFQGEHATMHMVGVVNCGFLVPSATWSATYYITSPTGLYVE